MVCCIDMSVRETIIAHRSLLTFLLADIFVLSSGALLWADVTFNVQQGSVARPRVTMPSANVDLFADHRTLAFFDATLVAIPEPGSFGPVAF